MDPPMMGEEMSKLEESDTEINAGGVENNAYSFLSEFEDHEDSTDSETEED
jgi:hypothetical protein